MYKRTWFLGSKLNLLLKWSASCTTALTLRFERCLYVIRSFTATSSPLRSVHAKSILPMFFGWSFHNVFGRQGLRFPRTGNQWYTASSGYGLSMSIRCKWPNCCRQRFLMTAVRWSYFDLDLMELLVLCWDHTTPKILCWQRVSKALRSASSLLVSVKHSHACIQKWGKNTGIVKFQLGVQIDATVSPHLV